MFKSAKMKSNMDSDYDSVNDYKKLLIERIKFAGFDKKNKKRITDGVDYYSGLKNLFDLLGLKRRVEYEEGCVCYKDLEIEKPIIVQIAKIIACYHCGYMLIEKWTPYYEPYIENWIYKVSGEKTVLSKLTTHIDDGGAVAYKTVSVIFYLEKDEMLKGGRLIIHNSSKKILLEGSFTSDMLEKLEEDGYIKIIDIKPNSVVVIRGDVAHTIEPCSGFGIRNCLVVQLPEDRTY